MRCFLACTALMAVAVVAPGGAGAQATPPSDPDVVTLLRGMKAALEPPRPSLRELEVVLRDAEGTETRWQARQARKHGPTGARIAMVMTGPAEIAGSAVLISEQAGAPDAQWQYLPAVRRVRKLYPVGGYHPFLGSDFTYADLGFITLDRRSAKLLGTDTDANGTTLYRIEEVPENGWYYSRIVDSIAADTLLPVRREFFTPAGELWKTQVFEAVTRVDDVPTPIVSRMHDRLEGGSTELRVLRVRYDREVPEDVFDPAELPKLLDHPVWKTLD